jgi:hypothetical protein
MQYSVLRSLIWMPGCCGMAGSFGSSRDHYGVSETIANRRLLPAAKAMQGGRGIGRARYFVQATGCGLGRQSREYRTTMNNRRIVAERRQTCRALTDPFL